MSYDYKIDIWSLGCIIAELWTGFVLFDNDSVQSLLSRYTILAYSDLCGSLKFALPRQSHCLFDVMLPQDGRNPWEFRPGLSREGPIRTQVLHTVCKPTTHGTREHAVFDAQSVLLYTFVKQIDESCWLAGKQGHGYL